MLKSIFKVNDNDLIFAKAVEIAAGVEDASRVVKETVYGSTSETVLHEITARKNGKTFSSQTNSYISVQESSNV